MDGYIIIKRDPRIQHCGHSASVVRARALDGFKPLVVGRMRKQFGWRAYDRLVLFRSAHMYTKGFVA